MLQNVPKRNAQISMLLVKRIPNACPLSSTAKINVEQERLAGSSVYQEQETQLRLIQLNALLLKVVLDSSQSQSKTQLWKSLPIHNNAFNKSALMNGKLAKLIPSVFQLQKNAKRSVIKAKLAGNSAYTNKVTKLQIMLLLVLLKIIAYDNQREYIIFKSIVY